MKPTHRRLAIIGLSALLITSAGSVLAFGGAKGQHGGCDRDGRHDAPMPAISQLEDLSTEQRNQLREIRRAGRDAMRDLRDEIRDNRTDLRDAMADNADLDTIHQLAEKQGDQVARMFVLRAEMRSKVNGVLTEAQREQLNTLRMTKGDFGRHGERMRF